MKVVFVLKLWWWVVVVGGDGSLTAMNTIAPCGANKNVKIPDRDYNNLPRERFLIDYRIIQECENSAD